MSEVEGGVSWCLASQLMSGMLCKKSDSVAVASCWFATTMLVLCGASTTLLSYYWLLNHTEAYEHGPPPCLSCCCLVIHGNWCALVPFKYCGMLLYIAITQNLLTGHQHADRKRRSRFVCVPRGDAWAFVCARALHARPVCNWEPYFLRAAKQMRDVICTEERQRTLHYLAQIEKCPF